MGQLEQDDLGKLWQVWETLTQELLRREMLACEPFSVTHFEEASALKEDLLFHVRQARRSAEEMKRDFPAPAPQ